MSELRSQIGPQKLSWHLLQIYLLKVGSYFILKELNIVFFESFSKIKAVMAVSWFVCVLFSQQILERSKKFNPKTTCLQQILCGLSWDIKIYSPKVSNTRRHEAELNVISARVSKFDTQRKCMQYGLYYLLYYNYKTSRMKKMSLQFKYQIFIFQKCIC